jgi:threonine-phosphate decarboxylase
VKATPPIQPVHGGQLRQIAAHFGIPEERLTDFSANINPIGPPSSVLTAIQRALEDPTTLSTYPDLELIELKRTIADNAGVQVENVAVANGFVPLLESALRSRKIERCLLPVPSFNEYRRVLENANIIVDSYCLSPSQGFAYDADMIIKTLLDRSCDAILLANPQNPSGALCSAPRMKSLIKMAARHNVTVLLDEAFIDYSPGESLTRQAMELVNLIVFRSVTKFFAMPGLRVAYAIGNSNHIAAMNRFIASWPITSIASDAACAALSDQAHAEESRISNGRRRRWLERELTRLTIAVFSSNANFLLLRFPAEVDVNLLWERMIVEEQIVLRSCANFEELTEGYLRIAVRSEPDNERLIHGLKRVLAGLPKDGRELNSN